MSIWRRDALLIGASAVLVVGGAIAFRASRPATEPTGAPARPSGSTPQAAPPAESTSTEVPLPESTSKGFPGWGKEPWRTCRHEPERRIDRAAVTPLLAPPPHDAKKLGRMTPERDAGALRGMRVTEAGPTTLLARLGVQRGDLIESINGFPMDNLERLRTAPQLDKLTVLVDRGGVNTCVELDLDE
jgi:hypothetical protein